MPEPELTCLLRRLNICDGHDVVRASPRADVTQCYCRAIAELTDELGGRAHQLRIERACAVARSSELQRIRDRRRFLVPEDW